MTLMPPYTGTHLYASHDANAVLRSSILGVQDGDDDKDEGKDDDDVLVFTSP